MTKNSTSFKPGQSGNPKGRPKLPVSYKRARNLSPHRFRHLIEYYATADIDELRRIWEEKTAPAVDLIIIRFIVDSLDKCNVQAFNLLLDRMMGKVAQQVQIDVKPVVTFETNINEDGTLTQKLMEEVVEGEVFGDGSSETTLEAEVSGGSQ